MLVTQKKKIKNKNKNRKSFKKREKQMWKSSSTKEEPRVFRKLASTQWAGKQDEVRETTEAGSYKVL